MVVYNERISCFLFRSTPRYRAPYCANKAFSLGSDISLGDEEIAVEFHESESVAQLSVYFISAFSQVCLYKISKVKIIICNSLEHSNLKLIV